MLKIEFKRLMIAVCVLITMFIISIIGIVISFSINRAKTDEESKVLMEMFVQDLLNKEFEEILEYTYISDSKSITVEEFKEMVLSHDDTRMLLQFEQSELNYYNSGDFNLRTITITGRDKEDNFYKSDFKVKKIDGKFWLYFDEISND